MHEATYSDDEFLGGKLIIRQPVHGYRAAMDPVLLAACLPSSTRAQSVLDVGTGAGTAGLCYLSRHKQALMTGIELQEEMIKYAHWNTKTNGFSDRFRLIQADILEKNQAIHGEAFDMVLTNPPFLEGGKTLKNDDETKTLSNRESTATLGDWLKFSLKRLKQKGHFAMIHRADRLDEILHLLYGHLGDIEVIPLWPKRNKSPKRVIIRGRKAVKGSLSIHPGLLLHTENSRYTCHADAILRNGKGLDEALLRCGETGTSNLMDKDAGHSDKPSPIVE